VTLYLLSALAFILLAVGLVFALAVISSALLSAHRAGRERVRRGRR